MTNKVLWTWATVVVVGGAMILIIVFVVFFPDIPRVPPGDKRIYLGPYPPPGGFRIVTQEPLQFPIQTESAKRPESTTPDRCGIFDQDNMEVVYPAWEPGAPLQVYFKMPGGVPGLEKPISGDPGPWEYELKIGEYSSTSCEVIQGYPNRMYCPVEVSTDYSNAVRSMALRVNGCDKPIYENSTAYLPGIEGQKTGGGNGGNGGSVSCTIGLDQNACVAAGGTYNYSTSQGFCVCP